MTDLTDMINRVMADWEHECGCPMTPDILLKADRYVSDCQQAAVEQGWTPEMWAFYVVDAERRIRTILADGMRKDRAA